MEENRKQKRMPVETYFAVRKRCKTAFFAVKDHKKNKSLGHLMDISTGGMRIIGNDALDLGVSFELVIELPHKINDCDHIIVEAWCRWCHKPEKSAHYYAGFKFHEISEHDREIIDYIISSSQEMLKNQEPA